MLRVLIADELSPRAVEIFQSRGIEADVRTGLPPVEIEALIGGYDGLAIRSATKVTAKLLAKAERLKVIGRAGIGVDNVDVPAATQRGIVVMNTPHGNSVTTAEHAIALMFALARQLPAADHSTQAGKWEKSRFMGVELAGKTLGIIGCGNIGSIVADRAHGLKMKVLGFDPYLSRGSGLRSQYREGRARRSAGARRFHHLAHAADRQHPPHHQCRGPGQDQARGADHQLRPGRAGGGGGSEGRHRIRPCGGRGPRRLRRGARPQQRAVRHGAGGGHAASRRRHGRGAGEGGAPGGRADGRFPAHRGRRPTPSTCRR